MNLIKTVSYEECDNAVQHDLYCDDSFIAYPAYVSKGQLLIDLDAIKTGGADASITRDPTVARDFAVANYCTILMRDTILPTANIAGLRFGHGRFLDRPTQVAHWRDYSDKTEDMLTGRGLTPTTHPTDGYRATFYLPMKAPHPSWADRLLHIWVTASGHHASERLELGLANAKLENSWTTMNVQNGCAPMNKMFGG